MNSYIYEGTIRHRRFRPRANAFKYRLFFMFIDLKELPTLFDIHPLWSYNQFNVAYFNRKDHFGDPHIPLDQAVRELVFAKTNKIPQGPIRMLTHLRYFGHCFNPATFFYCYDKTDSHVETIVVEIHNTPWGEVFCYVLADTENEHPLSTWRRFRFKKIFHVSPFIDMDVYYDWRFQVPGDTLKVHMIDYRQGVKLFDASLQLKRYAIDHRRLTYVLVAYPLMTVKVITMIYFQALRLLLKKVPFYAHPETRV